MKLIKTEDAVGQVLCHDITQIIKGVTKDAVFRKGHIITEEDIPVLLSVGKDNVYIWEKEEGMVHENDAAEVLRSFSQNEYMEATAPKEGKIELVATCDGVLKINRDKLNYVNSIGEIMIASRHGDFPVKKGDKIAGMRIIPLLIKQEKLDLVKKYCEGEPIFKIKPFNSKKVAIITTGNEVYFGRIKDTFTPVIEEKLLEYKAEVVYKTVLGDDHEKITLSCLEAIEKGANFVICTGGMSVDPDDKTPLAIKNTKARVVSYGAPVLPGAMFMLSYYDKAKLKNDNLQEIDIEKENKFPEKNTSNNIEKENSFNNEMNIPIVGLPGCVMYAKRTIFDLVLPRIIADDEISGDELARLGEGGLCLNCDICTFPNCGFGKGR